MKRVMNEKGMSAVVTTLILIVLALVAVGIVWVVISNIISDTSGGINLESITLDLEIKKVQVEGDISIQVYRKSGEGNLTGLRFLIYDSQGDSHSFDKETSIKSLGYETFVISDYTGEGVTKVEIAPILTTDKGKKKTLGTVDSYEIVTQCTGSDVSTCPGGGIVIQYLCDGNIPYNRTTTYTCVNSQCVAGEPVDSYGPECGTGYECSAGVCVPEGCTPDCSCASDTCIGSTCNDGCGGTCAGTKECAGGEATIFVTSVTYTGKDIGGLSGADAKCQALASAAGLSGTWKAWLSVCLPTPTKGCASGTSAASRLTHSTSPYMLPDETKVADDWDDLTDGDLDAPINMDENGNSVARIRVATGTKYNGDNFHTSGDDYGRYCFNWGDLSGGWCHVGYTDMTDYHWSSQVTTSCSDSGCGGGYCTTEYLKLYCLKQ